MRKIFAVLILFFPWFIRRRMYQKIFGFEIDQKSYIGFSIIFPKRLIMKEYSRIGNFNICKQIDRLELKEHAIIENLNRITGFPSQTVSKHFSDQKNREPVLIIGEHVGISSMHFFDCTDKISIGKFTTIAGYGSQFLTHSINLQLAKQECSKIIIGDFNFIGTDSTVLKGCKTDDFNIFGAKSLLNKEYSGSYNLYGGVPAKKIKRISDEYKYFKRTHGYID